VLSNKEEVADEAIEDLAKILSPYFKRTIGSRRNQEAGR
jgi:predicted site-specific integrase-resolvase